MLVLFLWHFEAGAAELKRITLGYSSIGPMATGSSRLEFYDFLGENISIRKIVGLFEVFVSRIESLIIPLQLHVSHVMAL